AGGGRLLRSQVGLSLHLLPTELFHELRRELLVVRVPEVDRGLPSVEEQLVVEPEFAVPQGGLEPGHEVVSQAVWSDLQPSGPQDHAYLPGDGRGFEEGRALHVRWPSPAVVVAVVVGPYDRAFPHEDLHVCDTAGKVVLKEDGTFAAEAWEVLLSDLAEFSAYDGLHRAAKNDDPAGGQGFQVDVWEIA